MTAAHREAWEMRQLDEHLEEDEDEAPTVYRHPVTGKVISRAALMLYNAEKVFGTTKASLMPGRV